MTDDTNGGTGVFYVEGDFLMYRTSTGEVKTIGSTK